MIVVVTEVVIIIPVGIVVVRAILTGGVSYTVW